MLRKGQHRKFMSLIDGEKIYIAQYTSCILPQDEIINKPVTNLKQ